MAASASGGRDWYAALPLPWRTDSLGYVLRSIGAAALALGLGLYLQLDSPFSAASTVLLLINPVQGAVVGKGWWRAVGTLVGTLAAFVLTALFAQKMLLFVVALGFWLGLCVGVMSLVRHFYATAAVVAGYTVCLALGPAMVEPEAAFEHIVTRASAVIVGVCCLSLVTVLFSRRTVSGRVRQRLVSLCAATLALVAARHAGAADGELERRRRTLAGEVYAVDDLLGVGRAESRVLSAALPAIRGGLAALFSTLMEFRFAGETHWARCLAERGLALPMADDLRLLGGQLERGELDFAGAARRLASLRGRLAAIRRGLPTDQADACREGLFMERLDEQLDDLQAALRGFARLDGRAPADVRPAAFHRHYREALRNGARAWLAM
ncbi:FUSC family protein, partial [Pseudomonas sp. AFW1]